MKFIKITAAAALVLALFSPAMVSAQNLPFSSTGNPYWGAGNFGEPAPARNPWEPQAFTHTPSGWGQDLRSQQPDRPHPQRPIQMEMRCDSNGHCQMVPRR